MNALRKTFSRFGRSEEPSKGLVVLIHGFLGTRVQMVPMAAKLYRCGFDVINFGYPTRRHNLEDHALTLVDVIQSNIARTQPKQVHFLSHSFGGVVLRAALKNPDCPEIAQTGRVVLVAPPIRGSSFARALKRLPRPLSQLASVIVGKASGSQLMDQPREWYDSSGGFPKKSKVLLIAGNAGKMNPWIDEDSDGVVALSETQVSSPHRRIVLNATHNLLMYHSRVLDAATRFLNGEENVGEEASFPTPGEIKDARNGALE